MRNLKIKEDMEMEKVSDIDKWKGRREKGGRDTIDNKGKDKGKGKGRGHWQRTNLVIAKLVMSKWGQ
jgi:hypothetical protein